MSNSGIIGCNDVDSDSVNYLLQEAIKGNLDVNSITSSEVFKMAQQKVSQHLLRITLLNCGYNISTLMTYFNNI